MAKTVAKINVASNAAGSVHRLVPVDLATMHLLQSLARQ